MDELSMFDLLPEDQAEQFKQKKSTDWKWTFKDYPKEKNGLTVFSCFACGGGSTMGYKLAGCDVLGCVEIDPRMNEIYVKNHHPKYNFCMDLRDFNKLPNEELPPELFNLDILDGSPPCTTFSMAGDREDSWGKKKKFREGQAEQTLDDLSFVFIETVAKLKPKVVIMENVEGLLLGEAFSYMQRIYADFKKNGYVVHHWLLKGENMGVPQRRHRVFFVGIRNDIKKDPTWIDMTYNYEPILFKNIIGGEPRKMSKDSQRYKMLTLAIPHVDHCIADVLQREEDRYTSFNDSILWDDEVSHTLTAKGNMLYGPECRPFTYLEEIRIQTFPEDYDFCGTSIEFLLGMSVPPIMMKRVVLRLIEQGVFDYKKEAT